MNDEPRSELDYLMSVAFKAAQRSDSASVYRSYVETAWKNGDPEVRRLWNKLVHEPVYNAVNRYQPILKKHKMMDQVFRLQDLDALVDKLEAETEDGDSQGHARKHQKSAHPHG